CAPRARACPCRDRPPGGLNRSEGRLRPPLARLGRLRLGVEEPAPVRKHDRLDALAQVELLEDVRDVRLDRRVADVELLPDLDVREALRDEPEVVTSAAVVMFGVFSAFGALSLLMFKQFGVGLAVAILIDATIVRGVLLPATMRLLGERNWYLPRWLDWLPRLRAREPPARRRRRRRSRRSRLSPRSSFPYEDPGRDALLPGSSSRLSAVAMSSWMRRRRLISRSTLPSPRASSRMIASSSPACIRRSRPIWTSPGDWRPSGGRRARPPLAEAPLTRGPPPRAGGFARVRGAAGAHLAAERPSRCEQLPQTRREHRGSSSAAA